MAGHGSRPIAAAYAELELPPGASLEEVREQYRLLSVAWHPDKWPQGPSRARAEEKMTRVNLANDLLQRHLKDGPEAERPDGGPGGGGAARAEQGGRRGAQAAEKARREREYRLKLARIEEKLAEDAGAAGEAILERQRPLLEAVDSARQDLARESRRLVAEITSHQDAALREIRAAISAETLAGIAASRISAPRSRDDRGAVDAAVGAVREARAELQTRRGRLAAQSRRRIAEATEQQTAVARGLEAKRQALLHRIESEIDSAAGALAKEAAAARRRLLHEYGMANDAT